MAKKEHIATFTIASLPWITVIAVNPLFRATYLANDGSRKITLKFVRKLKPMRYEKPSSVVAKATRDQVEGIEPCPEIRSKIVYLLSFKSNQELPIELAALENLKEKVEQA